MEVPVKYVDSSKDLKSLVNHLDSKQAIGIDLEFDKNHYRYGFNLCLMQIFDGEKCYLIDPLPETIDIQLIFPILENPIIEKICFAFNEDMRLLTHLGANVKGVRDLAVARIMLGKEGLSLSNTLVDELDRDPQNSLQKSNWYQRPLSEEQKHYAALDVVDLLELKDSLFRQLKDVNRMNWFNQEMNQFETTDWDQSNQPLIADKERKDLTLLEWMRYEALMKYRDEVSEQMNRPAYKVIDKNIIKDIARDPSKISRWENQKRIHPKYRNKRSSDQIKKIVSESEKSFEDLDLSKNTPARKPLTNEEKLIKNRERNQINSLKESFFKPVKTELIEAYGEPIANYMLSNRRIAEIVVGKLSLLPYQVELIKKMATKRSLPLPSIIN